MELEFNKTGLPYLRRVIHEVKEQEETGEIRLQDDAPDIARVLCNWGQVLIRSKEWKGNGLTVSGGVMAKVLYESDGEEGLRCTETWIPFQVKCDFPQTEKDGVICAAPRLLGLDTRMASARKMIVRAHIGVCVKAMVHDSLEIPVPPDLPEDVQLLKNKYPFQIPVEAGEKAFSVEEDITFPNTITAQDKLVSYSVAPILTESKIMGDKLIFRGTARIRIVYINADDRLNSLEHEIQLSQFTQLDDEYGEDVQSKIQFAVTCLEVEQAQEGNWHCKVGIAAQYIIYYHAVTEIVQDAFSTIRSVSCTCDSVQIPAVLESREITVQSECTVPLDIREVTDAVFWPGIPNVYTEDGMLYADLSGNFQVLGSDVMGNYNTGNSKWFQSIPMDCDDKVSNELNLDFCGSIDSRIDGDTVVLQAQLPIEIETVNRQPLSMVTAVELGDPIKQNSEKPSVIIRRVGDESLWEIAKSVGSTVDAIRKANGIEAEPTIGQLLLIPIT